MEITVELRREVGTMKIRERWNKGKEKLGRREGGCGRVVGTSVRWKLGGMWGKGGEGYDSLSGSAYRYSVWLLLLS